MCTVTYLPYRSGFILTHNRDEAPGRSPEVISRERVGEDTVLFPRDTRAGGAWIATGRSGRTACLMNGAFEKHAHRPPYRLSRGLVLLDFFARPHAEEFFEQYSLEGIEPFTLLHFEAGRVGEFRWDGQQRHSRLPGADQPHFWCSSTLYPPYMRGRREQVFRHWLSAQPVADPARLAYRINMLHRRGSVGDPENDYIMNREGRVQTVSITQVVANPHSVRMSYFNLVANRHSLRQLALQHRLAHF